MDSSSTRDAKRQLDQKRTLPIMTPRTTHSYLANLPVELILLVSENLDVFDVISLSSCCTRLHATLKRRIWDDALQHEDEYSGQIVASWAAYHNRVDTLRNLLKYRALQKDKPLAFHAIPRDITPDGDEIPDEVFDNAPLMVAAERGHVETVRFLLTEAAECVDVNYQSDEDGCSPLRSAAEGGSVGCIKLLLEHGADISAAGYCSMTPLHDAVYVGYVPAVGVLIDAGANVEQAALYPPLSPQRGTIIQDRHFESRRPLDIAAVEADYRMFAFLLVDRGCETDYANETGRRPLHSAARGGNVGICKLLLVDGTKRVSVDNIDSERYTPLHYAAMFGHVEVAKLLVDKGAEIDAQDAVGKTSLHHAVDWGRHAVAEYLLEEFADINMKTNMGLRAIVVAASKGDRKMARVLIQAGANTHGINFKDLQRRHR